MEKSYKEKLKEIKVQLSQIERYLSDEKAYVSESLEKYTQFLVAEHSLLLENIYNQNDEKVEKIPLITL